MKDLEIVRQLQGVATVGAAGRMSICNVPDLARILAEVPATIPDSSGPIAPANPATLLTQAGFAARLLVVAIVIAVLTYGRRRLEWSPARVPEERNASLSLWLGGAAMFWLFLAIPTALALVSAHSPTTQPLGVDGYLVALGTMTYLLAFAGTLAIHRALPTSAPLPAMLGLTPLARTIAPGKAIVATLVAIPFTYVVVALSMLLWNAMGWQHADAHQLLLLLARNEDRPWVAWLTILNAILLAPVFEEVLFRGHLQTALVVRFPRQRWLPILIVSLLFGLMHEGWTMPAMVALSIVIGLAYEWTGSLLVAIAIHVLFNSLSTLTFLLTR